MKTRIFLTGLVSLLLLIALTNPVLVQTALQHTPTPTPTASTTPTPTASSTPTRDPFANVPTSTPQTSGQSVVVSVQDLRGALGDQPPTFTPVPIATPTPVPFAPEDMGGEVVELLPDPDIVYQPGVVSFSRNFQFSGQVSPPTRIKIDKLGIDAPVQPVGMMPVIDLPEETPKNFVAPAVPDDRATVGWVDVSAPFKQPGNTVLVGRHHNKKSVFYNVRLLKIGDEISLATNTQVRTYIISEVLLVAERGQVMETRLQNAQYTTQPTDHEQLTLVTGQVKNDPYRVIVIAYPE